MLSMFPVSPRQQKRIGRRGFLGSAGVAAAMAGSPLTHLAARETVALTHPATAKRCIYIFLCGGPSQLDMWDPKPNAPAQIRGPIGTISTNVNGINLGEVLPQVSRHADKFAIVRSLHHDSTSHDTGIMYTLLADSTPPTRVSYPPSRSDHPGLGGILQSWQDKAGELPAWVTVPRPFTTGDRYYKGQTGGFLGPAYDPFALNEAKQDSLADKEFNIESLQPPDGVHEQRFVRRRQLLSQVEQKFAAPKPADSVDAIQNYYEQAFSLLSAAGARRAFDLTKESATLRERYGRNEYGQSFLLARRLVESGVQMVNVFWTYYGPDGCQFNLWDNHGVDGKVCGGFNRGIDMLRGEYCCPSFDRAYSALLEDLTDRGMLDDTLVVAVGEFGRTPKINKFAGRDHWPSCYSAVLAGGGVQGGQVFGASDAQAAYVKQSPVTPDDLGATVLHAFGYSPETPVFEPTGRPVRSSKGTPITALF